MTEDRSRCRRLGVAMTYEPEADALQLDVHGGNAWPRRPHRHSIGHRVWSIRLTPLLVALLLAAGVSACGSPEADDTRRADHIASLEEEGWVRYRSPDLGWSLYHPAEWIENPSGGGLGLDIEIPGQVDVDTGLCCATSPIFVVSERLVAGYADAPRDADALVDLELRIQGWGPASGAEAAVASSVIDSDLDGTLGDGDLKRFDIIFHVSTQSGDSFGYIETWYVYFPVGGEYALLLRGIDQGDLFPGLELVVDKLVRSFDPGDLANRVTTVTPGTGTAPGTTGTVVCHLPSGNC